MNELNSRTPVCGPDCRYRGLYEGSQASLTDMAHRQAQALARVGRLRSGVVLSLRRNFSKAFAEAELALGHRLSEVDDEILLAYLGHIMSASPAASSLIPDGMEELRKALTAVGIQVPEGSDLSSWADVIRAQKNAPSASSDNVAFFAPEIPAAFRAPVSDVVKESAPPKARAGKGVQDSKPVPRKTLGSLRDESKLLESSVEKVRDELSDMFKDFEPEDASMPEGKMVSPTADMISFDDLPPLEPPDEIEFELPPSDPYTPLDELAEALPFPDAAVKPKIWPDLTTQEAQSLPQDAPTDSLSDLFGEERNSSRAARRRKARKALQEKTEDVLPTPVLAEKPQITPVPWGSRKPVGEVNLKDVGEDREINLPQMRSPEVSLPLDDEIPFPLASLEDASLSDADTPKKISLASLGANVEPDAPAEFSKELPLALPSKENTSFAEDSPVQNAASQPSPKVMIPALRPEILPLMKVPPRSRKTPASRTARTQAMPPDGRLFADIPTDHSPLDGAELSEQMSAALLAAVCIPRPVFTSDLVSIAGSQEMVDAWEAECRRNAQSPVRFVAAKTRHRLRGSLVIPIDYLRDAATEFKRSAWAECMERYRGTTLYELAVLLHKIDSEVVATRMSENTLTLRLATRSGLVGIVVALTPKLAAGEITRGALAAELETLLSERLTLIAVLTPRAETFDPMCTAVTEEAKARQWSVPLPVIAARSWEYAEDRGAASQLLMGA